jgi:hypothetical protein
MNRLVVSKVAIPPEQGTGAAAGPQTAPAGGENANVWLPFELPARKYRYFRPISILSLTGM